MFTLLFLGILAIFFIGSIRRFFFATLKFWTVICVIGLVLYGTGILG